MLQPTLPPKPNQMVKERNEAVAKLTHEMMETERLEAERKGLLARIEALERGGGNGNGVSSSGPTGPVDVNKTMADANMKLKLEVGSNNH